MTPLGLGLGWRPELALAIERRRELGSVELGFVEVVAENVAPDAIPRALENLRARGVTVVPHGVSLSLGGAERPDPVRLLHLARLASRLGAPLVSEHACFVRAGGVDSGHLLPLPRTREALSVLVENVKIAQDALPVPLAIENIAAVFEWPGAELSEANFLAEVCERTGVLLLLDVANLHANARNLGWDPIAFLERIPLERVAYVHVAGGVEREGVLHDTHAHPVTAGALDLLAELVALRRVPGALLERDDRFPGADAIGRELDQIASILAGSALHV
jgi:uncharacterized protein (UPF0276 family)